MQNMAKNTRKTYKKHFFLDFPPNLPHKKYMVESFQKVDLTNNVLYSRGAPFRRAPAVAYMEYY